METVTVLTLLRRALRLVRACDANDVPEPHMVAGALEALNSMMRRWEANGLSLGWNTATLADDEPGIPEEAHEAVVYNLATRLRAEYGATLEPDVYAMASDGLALLRRDRIRAAPLRGRSACEYNIVTDDWCGGPPRYGAYP
jgi:hypothetical protein